MTSDHKSIRWTVTVAMIFVGYLAWGFMAGSYAANSHAGGIIVNSPLLFADDIMMISAIDSFVATSILEIPNLPVVISWNFANRVWLPILFFLLEVGILIGGLGLQRLEQKHSNSRGRRNR